jgi:hypothetical protein
MRQETRGVSMAILYTIDSRTVDEAEFKERIGDTGY